MPAASEASSGVSPTPLGLAGGQSADPVETDPVDTESFLGQDSGLILPGQTLAVGS